MKCLALLVLMSGLMFLQSNGHAQPPNPGPAGPKGKGEPQTSQKGGKGPRGAIVEAPPSIKTERTQYAVKNLDASTLASALNKHFKGDAEIVALPSGSGNTLLISGSTEAIREVLSLLAILDQKPKTVEIELVVAEIVSKKGADAKDVDVSKLEPLAKLEALTKAGQIGTIQRIKLTAVEGQPITSTNAGNKPYVSAATVGGGFGAGGGFGGGENPVPPGPGGRGAGGPGAGVVRRSISYHPAGVTVKLTARLATDDTIALDLNVQDSKIRPAEAGDDVGATFDNNTLDTKLNIPSGKAVAAQTVRSEGKTGETVSLVIVTARVAEPGHVKSK